MFLFSEKHHRGLKAKPQPVWCVRSRCILTISTRVCKLKKMKKMMPWSKLPSSGLERPARGRHKEPWCRRAETSKQKSAAPGQGGETWNTIDSSWRFRVDESESKPPGFGGGEEDYNRKVLYGQKEDLSSIPRTQVKKQTNKERLGVWLTYVTPVQGTEEIGRFWGLVAH